MNENRELEQWQMFWHGWLGGGEKSASIFNSNRKIEHYGYYCNVSD